MTESQKKHNILDLTNQCSVCHNKTTHNKPYCVDHICLMPQAIEILKKQDNESILRDQIMPLLPCPKGILFRQLGISSRSGNVLLKSAKGKVKVIWRTVKGKDKSGFRQVVVKCRG